MQINVALIHNSPTHQFRCYKTDGTQDSMDYKLTVAS